MSAHAVTSPEPARLRQICADALREPSDVLADPETGQVSYVFEPDLSADESAMLADLDAAASAPVDIGPGKWPSVRADMAALKAFAALPSPTSAQTASAARACYRVLRALLGDRA